MAEVRESLSLGFDFEFSNNITMLNPRILSQRSKIGVANGKIRDFQRRRDPSLKSEPETWICL